MRRTLSKAKEIASAVQQVMRVAASTLNDSRTPEKVMSDDIIGTLKKELMRRYGLSEERAGQSAGWTVKMLYQPSFKLEPHQFMFIMDYKVTFAPTIAQYHRFVRKARENMYKDTEVRGMKFPACVNEWLSEARKK